MIKRKIEQIANLLKTKTGKVILTSALGLVIVAGGSIAYFAVNNSDKTQEVAQVEDTEVLADIAEIDPNATEELTEEDKEEEVELSDEETSEDEVIIEEKVIDDNGNESVVTKTVTKAEAKQKASEGKVVSQKPAPAKPSVGSGNSSNSNNSSSSNSNSSNKPSTPSKPAEKPSKPAEKPAEKPQEKPQEKPKPSLNTARLVTAAHNQCSTSGNAGGSGEEDEAWSKFNSTGSAPSGWVSGTTSWSVNISGLNQNQAEGATGASVRMACRQFYSSKCRSKTTANVNGNTVSGTITYTKKA